MSVKIVTQYWSHYNSGISRTEVRGVLEVDTLSDLPTMDGISGYRLTIGTIAHIIDTAAVYKMDSSGSWHVQEQGTDFYTKAEIDTMMTAKADAATTYTKTQTNNLLAQKVGIYDVYGMGINIADITPAITSLDSITTPGKYYSANAAVSASVNAPYTRAGFGLLVIANSNNNRQTQILLPNPYGTDPTTIGWILFRQNLAGTYDSTWYKLAGTPV